MSCRFTLIAQSAACQHKKIENKNRLLDFRYDRFEVKKPTSVRRGIMTRNKLVIRMRPMVEYQLK